MLSSITIIKHAKHLKQKPELKWRFRREPADLENYHGKRNTMSSMMNLGLREQYTYWINQCSKYLHQLFKKTRLLLESNEASTPTNLINFLPRKKSMKIEGVIICIPSHKYQQIIKSESRKQNSCFYRARAVCKFNNSLTFTFLIQRGYSNDKNDLLTAILS